MNHPEASFPDRNLLDIFFERMPMSLVILDADLVVQRFNRTWADFVIRYTPTSKEKIIVGKNFFDIVPDSEDTFLPLLKRALQGETIHTEGLPILSGGTLSYWDGEIVPLIQNQQVTGILAVASDATQRIEAENELKDTLAALQEREQRLGLVMNASNDGIWDWDLESQTVYFSARWKSMLGYAEDEIENTFDSWVNLTHPEDREPTLNALNEFLESSNPVFYQEHRLRQKNGSYRWILSRGYAVRNKNGKVHRMVGFHSDIHDRKQAEESINYKVQFEKLITNISTHFINLPFEHIDDGINRALKLIGEFEKVDRSYVFLFSDDHTAIHNTHEWCAEGVQPQIELMRKVPLDQLSWSNRVLLGGEILHLPDLDSLPPEAQGEREIFRSQGIQSLISVPIHYQQRVIGFLGLDAVRAPKTWNEDSITLLKMVGEIIVNALEHKRAQTIQAGQRAFLELLATEGTFTETLNALVRIIEEQSPGMLGLILLLDEDGRHLHIGGAISLPQDYLDTIEGLEIGPLVGSCGTACYRKERVIVEDIDHDPRWDGLRSLAQQYGLRACWSEPVVSSGGEVIGTFAMYYRYARSPSEAELRTIEIAAHLAGVAIEHKRSQEALQNAFQTLEQRVDERTHELSTLLEVSRSITSTLDLEPLLGLILDQLRAVVDYNGASIMTLDDDELQTIAYRGPIPLEEVLNLRFSSDNPINGEVIHRRQAVIIEDVRGDSRLSPQFIDSAEQHGGAIFDYIRCWMGIPLIIQERTIGMLTLDHSIPGYYHVEHGELAVAFANHAALAIENARLYGEAQKRIGETQALLTVQQAITSHLEPDDVLQMIANHARELTNTDMSAVYLLKDGQLVISVVSGEVDPAVIGMVVPIDKSIAGLTLKTGKPILVPDSSLDERSAAPITTIVDARSFLIVPLLRGSERIGTITVANHRSGVLKHDIERVLTIMASSAVIALENAQLYHQEQARRIESERRRKVAEGLREILSVLNSNRTIEEVLDYMVCQARSLLESDSTMIRHADLENGVISTVASCNLPTDFDAVKVMRFLYSPGDQMLLSRKPLALSDLHASSFARLNNEKLEEQQILGIQIETKYYRSALAVPLFIKDQIYGSLRFYFSKPHSFTHEDIELATSLGDQVALAIENARLRAQAQESAAAAERSRLARDLHDAVTQTLFSASLIAEVLPRLWEKKPDEGLKRLNELRQLTRGALAEMRTLLMELRPTALMEAEISELFHQLSEAFIGRARIPLELNLQGSECAMQPDVRVSMYRIAQEALNNVAKHAHASGVILNMTCEPSRVELCIQDDGLGFNRDKVTSDHLGLDIMEERAESIGALLKVESEPGKGTRITALWQEKQGERQS